ncbi:MAG: GUN4 domain-containing protein [Leptolyngbyaceae cyanobacterium bins.349]|nr:GUN4 domain-containing protein [Leptolyngbyaceae cyanobacterium bins.349]
MMPQRFDVFLCHNSREKTEVEKIRTQLMQKGINAWLDKYDFEPFRPWQVQLEEIIPRIEVAAIFLGASGIGPWSDLEMRAFLEEFTRRGIRMGLVILPGCPNSLIKEVPIFLRSFHWVDFRQLDPDPMEQLIWGITGRKPAQNFTSPPKTPTSTQPNLPNLNANTSNLMPLGQPLANVWQSLGKQVERWNQRLDEYITSSLQDEHESTAPPTTTHSPSSHPPRQPLPISNAPEFDTPVSKSSNARNYTKLQNLLRSGKWREANQETTNRLCDMTGRTQAGWLRVDDIKIIPAEDLQTIDRLWMQYSQGKFGFSVQKRIWQECGSPVDFGEKWNTFGDRIGWCINGKWLSNPLLMCDLQNSPVGELPRLATNDVPVLMVRVLFKRFQS